MTPLSSTMLTTPAPRVVYQSGVLFTGVSCRDLSSDTPDDGSRSSSVPGRLLGER
jgi:hypothetical protein